MLSERGARWLTEGTGDVLSHASPDVIRMTTLETDFLKAPWARELHALKMSAETLLEYAPTDGTLTLRLELARVAQVEPDQVVVTDGASQALLLLLSALIDPSDGVLVPLPAFPAYERIVRLLGGVVRRYPTHEDSASIRHEIDVHLGPGCRVLILNSPNNPTGDCLTDADLRRVITIAAERNCFVILDDAYTWLQYPRSLSRLAEISDLGAPVAAVASLGKFMCLPGLRLGCVLTTTPELQSAVIEAKRHIAQCSCPVHESLATSILARSAHLEVQTALSSLLNDRRRRLSQLLLSSGIDPRDGAGFYLYAEGATKLDVLGIQGVAGSVFGGCPEARRLSLAISQPSWDRLDHVLSPIS